MGISAVNVCNAGAGEDISFAQSGDCRILSDMQRKTIRGLQEIIWKKAIRMPLGNGGTYENLMGVQYYAAGNCEALKSAIQ